ncbi:MAG: flagellar hook-associated protein FlgL [Fibrobacterota bacterium]
MMRVTFSQINDTVQRNINRNYAKLANLQEQLSSGRRLNRPSDNPIDMKNNINYKAELALNNQLKRNIEDGQGWIGMTEVAMTDMNEVMQRLRVLALEGDNATMTGTERGYIGQEANQLLKQLVSLSNTTYKGDFIFGGTHGDKQIYNYEEGTAYSFPVNAVLASTFQAGVDNPMNTYSNNQIYQYKRLDPGSVSLNYVVAGVPNAAVEGTDYTVDYAEGTIRAVTGSAFETALGVVGPNAPVVNLTFNHYNKVNRENNGSVIREIEEGIKVRINVSADELFEDTASNLDLIGVSVDLLDGLKRNNTSKINAAISEIDTVFNNMKAAQSSNGARLNRFELTLDRNSNKKIEVSRLQSELEDVDFATAIMDFSMSENVYNASLKAGAKVILPSLGDYI